MKQPIRITCLVDNTASRDDLVAEHGLAVWIDFGDRRLLFDTGQGQALPHNADALGIDLAAADAVVLSHGHYDHTGALGSVLARAPRVKVHAHPSVLLQKYSRRRGGRTRSISMPEPTAEVLGSRGDLVVWTNEPTEVFPGVWVTGQVPRSTAYEDVGGPFFLDARCKCPDLLDDDQALFFDTAAGTAVVCGCSHAGVVNTLQYIRGLTGERPVAAVVGGMHLRSASPMRIRRTVRALRKLRVGRLAPCHCTGEAATAALSAAFPGRCESFAAGESMEFNRP